MKKLSIIEFVEDPALIGDKSLSVAQKMVLKSIYGELLTREELNIFKKTTGLSTYRQGKERGEVSCILGRRSGKSDKIASNVALYEACARDHKLSVGQTGVVMVVASEKKRQAKIVHNYILGKLENSPVLKKMIKGITAEEISLTNCVVIQVFPCSVGKIRGQSLICFIGDETAYWKNEGKDVDVDVLDAARPGLDFHYSKMIKISSPGMMKGEIYQDYKQYRGKPNDDVLVFQGSTELFHPAYFERKKKQLAGLKKRKPLTYEQEYLAHFRADISSMFDPQIIDKAVNHDRPLELAPRKGVRYKCFVDCAGGGGKDHYAIALGHLENDRAVIDLVRSRPPKFNPDEVTAQYCELIKQYGVSKVHGDKFSGDWSSNSFAKFGIAYERSERTKSELYLESEGPFNTERIDLPNREAAITQLKLLVRKTRSGGRDSVDTDSGQPEDEANVICGLLDLLMSKKGGVGARLLPNIWPEEISGFDDEERFLLINWRK